jgi:hypothetical protein
MDGSCDPRFQTERLHRWPFFHYKVKESGLEPIAAMFGGVRVVGLPMDLGRPENGLDECAGGTVGAARHERQHTERR